MTELETIHFAGHDNIQASMNIVYPCLRESSRPSGGKEGGGCGAQEFEGIGEEGSGGVEAVRHKSQSVNALS